MCGLDRPALHDNRGRANCRARRAMPSVRIGTQPNKATVPEVVLEPQLVGRGLQIAHQGLPPTVACEAFRPGPKSATIRMCILKTKKGKHWPEIGLGWERFSRTTECNSHQLRVFFYELQYVRPSPTRPNVYPCPNNISFAPFSARGLRQLHTHPHVDKRLSINTMFRNAYAYVRVPVRVNKYV